MAEQMRPASKSEAPDPANSYERAKPERESPTGQLSAPKTNPPVTGDKPHKAVENRQDPSSNLVSDPGAHGKTHARERGRTQDLPVPGSVAADQPDHSMKAEEPLGADQRPIERTGNQERRQPRTGGKGGTPDVGERTTNG